MGAGVYRPASSAARTRCEDSVEWYYYVFAKFFIIFYQFIFSDTNVLGKAGIKARCTSRVFIIEEKRKWDQTCFIQFNSLKKIRNESKGK